MRVEFVGIFLSASLLCGCARDDVPEEINHAIDQVCSMRVNSHMMTHVGKAGATREEQLDVMIEMLSFMRKHIQRLREDVESHPTGKNGRVVTDMKAFMAYTECVRSYNGAAINYENYIFGVEYSEFDLAVKELPDDIKTKMRRKFETFLGRPMRTNAECRRDLEGHIHREFPLISLGASSV